MKYIKLDNKEMDVEFSNSEGEISEKDNYDPPFSWRSKIFKNELKTNLKMAFPALITNVFQYLLNVETLSFCGRLGATEMESVGLAISIMQAFGWCVCSGMVTACDTMFAQAFGSEDKKRTGLFLQRGLLMLNLVPIFLLTVHWNMEPILVLFGQDYEISRGVGEYLIAFSPGLIFMMNYIIFARFMQGQGCLWPPVVAGICGNIFNIVANLIFIMYLGYGLQVAALCNGLSFGIMFVCELIFVIKTKFYLTTWPGFKLEAFYDWLPMFKLGLAGVGHITFEVIVWEANVFIGGLIGTVELAAQSIFVQILNILYVLYYGAGISSNIRVGQSLGANKPNQAKAAYRAGLVSTGITVALIFTLMTTLRYQIPHIFTNNAEIIDMVIDVLPFLYLIFFFDPYSPVCSAALRGCGRQAAGSLIIFVAFYIIALPANIILAFVFKFGIKGLWIGTTMGSLTSLILTLLILECQDWNKQAKLAEQRILYRTIVPSNDSSNQEEQALLQPLSVEDQLLNKSNVHIRTPSYPVSCSTEIVKLPRPRAVVHKSMIYKKIFLGLIVLLFFICGVIIHIYLPTSLYRKENSSLV